MADLWYGLGVVEPSSCRDDPPIPRSRRKADRLATAIERAVARATNGGVRELQVEVRDREIVLTGRCSTFYTKQLAQHVAMELTGPIDLINSIEVCKRR